jgi:hypothetical protein
MSFCLILDLALRTITCHFFLEIHRKGLRKFIPQKKKKNGAKVVEEEEKIGK